MDISIYYKMDSSLGAKLTALEDSLSIPPITQTKPPTMTQCAAHSRTNTRFLCP